MRCGVLLVLTVLLGVALALAKGGSLRHLATLQLQGMGYIVASFAIQLVIYIPAVRHTAVAQNDGAAIYMVVLALMVIGVAQNWRFGPTTRLVLLGLVLNTAVVVANGGHMPVSAAALRSVQGDALVHTIAARHDYANRMLADRHSLLLPLSDAIPVPLPFGRGSVGSLGDLLIAAGAATLAFGATSRPRRENDAFDPALLASSIA
jgi:uncharacterized protein DUF5317